MQLEMERDASAADADLEAVVRSSRSCICIAHLKCVKVEIYASSECCSQLSLFITVGDFISALAKMAPSQAK